MATITALVEKPKRGQEKDVVNEERLQRVYKLYDDYRTEKRKQKQKKL